MAGTNWSQDPVHRTRFSLGERLLRKLQLQNARRIPERRNFLFTEGSAGAGRTLACLLQHRAATLFAGLQTASAISMAGRSFPAAWKSGKQKTLPTFPHRLILRRADIYLSRCATLTNLPGTNYRAGHSFEWLSFPGAGHCTVLVWKPPIGAQNRRFAPWWSPARCGVPTAARLERAHNAFCSVFSKPATNSFVPLCRCSSDCSARRSHMPSTSIRPVRAKQILCR